MACSQLQSGSRGLLLPGLFPGGWEAFGIVFPLSAWQWGRVHAGPPVAFPPRHVPGATRTRMGANVAEPLPGAGGDSSDLGGC